MKRTLLTVVSSVILSAMAACLQAATDPANWTTNGVPAGREPSSSQTDYVMLSNMTVHITAAATLHAFGNGSGGTASIDNGGVLAGASDYTIRYVSAVNVNDGGQFPMGSSWRIRSCINVNAGGTASGAASIYETGTKRITVNGTWSPRGTTVAAGTAFGVGSGVYPGSVVLGATGTVILDAFGDKTNEFFSMGGPSSLTLNTGSIQLRPQGSYVPKAGDSYRLWTNAVGSSATMNIGNGSNISILGSSFTLDTSEWATSGKVTVVGGSKGTAVLVR
jgi:hypothetical protein